MIEPLSAKPAYEFTFDYTPALGRAVFRAYFWRRFAGFAVASLASAVLALILLGSQDLNLLAAFLLGIDFALWWVWLRAYRTSGRLAEGLGSPSIRVTLDEAGCGFETAEGQSRVRWSAIGTLFRLKSAWVLDRAGRTHPTFLPLAALTPEVQAFLERRIRETGGRIL